jgi:hypothetical protein
MKDKRLKGESTVVSIQEISEYKDKERVTMLLQRWNAILNKTNERQTL